MSSLLLTSFATWRPHQRSNAADDLLQELLTRLAPELPDRHLLRQLPVTACVAQDLLLSKIQQVQPRWIVCCGMAETRHKLSLEARAVRGSRSLQTQLPLELLSAGLLHTEISNNAGRFVCNALYYSLLNYLYTEAADRLGLFIHVPPLTTANRASIAAEFQTILIRMCTTNAQLSGVSTAEAAV